MNVSRRLSFSRSQAIRNSESGGSSLDAIPNQAKES
jgi:hypothetical protein